MKLCIDCRHFDPKGRYGTTECLRTERSSPVDGSLVRTACSTERAFDVAGGCGPAGMNFEAKIAETAA